MHPTPMVRFRGGIAAIFLGLALIVASGNRYTALGVVGLFSAWAGVALFIGGAFSREFDTALDARLRGTLDGSLTISGHVHKPKRGRHSFWEQFVMSADESGATLLTASGSSRILWESVTKIVGSEGGPFPMLSIYANKRWRPQLTIRPHRNQPIEQLIQLLPQSVETRVRRWTFTRPLAIARWLLLAVTAVWVGAFAVDLVFGHLGFSWFVALAAGVAVWATLTAIAFPKLKLWSFLSMSGLAAAGLPLSLAISSPSSNTLSDVVGLGLSLAEIAILLLMTWAAARMELIRGAGTKATITSKVVISLSALVTAFFGCVYAINFLNHESPPTSGHVIAGVAIGIPALAILALVTRKARNQLIVGAQAITGLALVIALSEQRLAHDVSYVFQLLVMVVIPMGVAAIALRKTRGTQPERLRA